MILHCALSFHFPIQIPFILSVSSGISPLQENTSFTRGTPLDILPLRDSRSSEPRGDVREHPRAVNDSSLHIPPLDRANNFCRLLLLTFLFCDMLSVVRFFILTNSLCHGKKEKQFFVFINLKANKKNKFFYCF